MLEVGARRGSDEKFDQFAGLYVSALSAREGARQDGIVWGAQAAGWTVNFAGKDYLVDLRHERYPMPFTIADLPAFIDTMA